MAWFDLLISALKIQYSGSIKDPLEKDLEYNLSGAAQRRRGAGWNGKIMKSTSGAVMKSTSGAARHGMARSTLIRVNKSLKCKGRGTARHGEEYEELTSRFNFFASMSNS